MDSTIQILHTVEQNDIFDSMRSDAISKLVMLSLSLSLRAGAVFHCILYSFLLFLKEINHARFTI